MSWGWIIVIFMGFLPLALVFLTGNRNRQQQQQQHNNQTEDRRSSKNSGKGKRCVYSGWRIVLSADTFMSIPSASALKTISKKSSSTAATTIADMNASHSSTSTSTSTDDSTIMEEESATPVTTIPRTHLALIQRLVQDCDVYIVAQVQSDAQEQSVLQCVKRKMVENDNKSLCDCGLNEHKVLFCETSSGQIAIARQLEPDLFVGTDSKVTKELSRFLGNVSQTLPVTTGIDQQRGNNKNFGSGTVVYPSLNALFATLE